MLRKSTPNRFCADWNRSNFVLAGGEPVPSGSFEVELVVVSVLVLGAALFVTAVVWGLDGSYVFSGSDHIPIEQISATRAEGKM
jgi:hypothetical protein